MPNVGIGTTSPSFALDTVGTGKFSTGIIAPKYYPTSDAVNSVNFTKADASTSVMSLDTTNGRVGIGTTSPTASLHVAGGSNLIGGIQVKVTSVTATTYTTLSSDYFICVSASAATTITLMASPPTGTSYVIKDCGGNASTYNITIQPSAGNIDGTSSYVITTNRQSLGLIYDGTQWEVN